MEESLQLLQVITRSEMIEYYDVSGCSDPNFLIFRGLCTQHIILKVARIVLLQPQQVLYSATMVLLHLATNPQMADDSE